MKYITEGFEAFRRGSFENGGQNLYVSRKGVLQRIFQYDINQDGYPDLQCLKSPSSKIPVPCYRRPASEALQLPQRKNQTHG